MNDLTVFNFETMDIRTIELDDQVWFVAKDVAQALGYTDTDQAIRKHCKHQKSYPAISTGQVRNMMCIKQNDVTRLIVKSTKPEAEKFESWVFDEVIPQVLKTGSYQAKPMTQMELAQYSINKLVEHERQLAQIPILTDEVTSIKERVAFLQSPQATEIPSGFMSTKQIVKNLGHGLSKDVVFNMALKDKGIAEDSYMAIVDGVGFVKSTCFHALESSIAINEFVSTLHQVTKTQCESTTSPGKRLKFTLVK